MKTMENGLKNRKSEPRTRVASLEEKLRSQVRLLDADKKILAENLGCICAELNPDKPLTAVSLLIEKSGLQSLQQKRKRFIRLPGEEESPIGEKGAYGASGETFATLASTAAQMRSTSNDENVKEREKEYCFKRLLRGTSFLPVYKPESLGGRSTKDILDEYAARLNERIAKDTRLTELWEILEKTHFGYKAFTADEWKVAEAPKYGAAAIIPDALVKIMFSERIKGAYFDNENKWPWDALPYLSIGKVALSFIGRLFVIPDSVARCLYDDGGCLSFGSEGNKWFAEICGDSDELPEIAYDRKLKYGWREQPMSFITEVFLRVENVNGKPSISLNTDYMDYQVSEHYEYSKLGNQIPLAIGADQLRIADSDFFSFLTFFLYAKPMEDEDPIEGLKIDGYPIRGPIGILDHECFPCNSLYPQETGWTDDEMISRILMGNDVRFYPSIDKAEPIGVALNPGSVGAGIIANLRDAENEDRIDKILIERAKLMAEAGIGFYEAVFDEARKALLKISED
jgi:hypothetical protein